MHIYEGIMIAVISLLFAVITICIVLVVTEIVIRSVLNWRDSHGKRPNGFNSSGRYR